MFSKTKDNGSTPPEPPAQAARRPSNGRVSAPSIICSDMTVSGVITCTGDMQIDGKIEGDIFSSRLTVGEKAVISGEIRADEVTIRGHVVGGIRARKVNLAATCHVEGDIMHNALAVETGAFFQGNIRHADDPLADAMTDAAAHTAATETRPASRPQQQQPAPAAPAPSASQGGPALSQGAPASGPAGAPQQRGRQTFAQLNNGAGGGAAQQPAQTGAPASSGPRSEANDALNAALQKLNANAGPAPRPAAPAQGGPAPSLGANGQFPPRGTS